MPEIEQITDPFSLEFMELSAEKSTEIAHQLKENLVNVRQRSARTKTERVKFYLSRDFKKRLKHLINLESEDSPTRIIGTALLNKKYIEKDSINYLGLSNDDFTKISYVNTERYEKIKDRTFEDYYIIHGTKILFTLARKNAYGTYEEDGELKYGLHTKTTYGSAVFTKHATKDPIKLVKTKIPRELVTHEDGSKEMLYDYEFKLPTELHLTLYSKSGGIIVKDGIVSPYVGYESFKHRLHNLKRVVTPSIWDPEQRFHSSVQKVLNKVFPIEFSERDKNLFAASYYRTVIFEDPSYEMKIIEGNDIKEAYLSTSYLPCNHSNLWNSCMRHSHCEDYFEIYTDYPEIVKMAVLYKHGKVAARSLIWTVDGKKYFDRVYSYHSMAESLITQSLLSRDCIMLREFHGGQKDSLSIPFSYSKIDNISYFPYLDSFQYYSIDEEALTNYEPDGEFLQFCEIDGSYRNNKVDEYCCDHCGDEVLSEELSEITLGRYRGQHACNNCAAYSEQIDETMLRTESTYCEYSEAYFPNHMFTTLRDGTQCWDGNADLIQYENDFGYFLTEHHEYTEINGEYYHPEDPKLEELQQEQLTIKEITENENNTIEQTESIDTNVEHQQII